MSDYPGRKTILCIDDDSSMLGYQRALLEKRGFAVLTAASVSYTHLDVYKRQANRRAVPYSADMAAHRSVVNVAIPHCLGR